MEDLKKILECIYTVQDNLNQAGELLSESSLKSKKENLKSLGMAFSYISQVERSIYDIAPELEPEEEMEPDGEPTEEEKLIINTLSQEQLREIDAYLLSCASDKYRKVAMIVGTAMTQMPNRVKGIPDVFYSARVRMLVENNKLVSQGNLDYMRYSEVKLAESDA